QTVIRLTDIGERIAGVDTKRRCATAGRTHLSRCQSLIEQTQRQLVTLDTRQAKTTGEGTGAAEVSFIRVVDVDVTYAAAKLDRMRAHLLRGEIVQLPTLALIERLANLGATRAKRTTHVQSGDLVAAVLFVVVGRILKARLVDGCGVQYRGLSQLNVLIYRERVVGAL